MLDERVLVTSLRLLHPLVLYTFEERFFPKELHAYAIFEYLNHFKLHNKATAAEISWERSIAQRIMSVYEKYVQERMEHPLTNGYSRTTSIAFDSTPFSPPHGWNSKFAKLPLVKGDDGFSDAAYRAAITSFKQVLEQLRCPDAYLYFSVEQLTRSLCGTVLNSFNSFQQAYTEGNCWSFIHLEIIIKVAAYIAEDIISSDMNQRLLGEGGPDYEYFLLWLFTNTLAVEDTFPESTGMSHHDASYLNDTTVDADDDLVGLDDDLMKIKDQLTGFPSKLKIIPIVGMGGIGKTTLARRLYEDPLIIYHFYARAWITVSQEYNLRDVLWGLLSSAELHTSKASEETDDQLAGKLYRSLKRKRYLIVMDNMWNTKTWDDLKRLFPNDNNGSRIIITSRLMEVAVYANPDYPPHCMNFISIQQSWRLLCNKVFGKGTCPTQLVDIGKQIAEKCQGLPLAIILIAGHLSKISKTQACWKKVAKRIGSLISGTQDQLFDILSMSYNFLPQQLKACFLYMVIFPKNSEIPVWKLIRLWIAAGFIQVELSNSLEEEAEKCLEDLISRSLIMVRKRKSNGKVKTCGIHDLVWDLTFRVARKEGNVIYGLSRLGLDSYFHIGDERENLMRLAFSFLYFDHCFISDFHPSSMGFKQLRVLDIVFQSFFHFPIEIIQLVNLRYLALATYSNLPGSVSKLSNLETLINHHASAGPILPKGIWKIPHLRHLHVGTCSYLPDPLGNEADENVIFNLPGLQTLSTICSASCTREVFSRIPNLKEIKIHEIGEDCSIDEQLLNCLKNLAYLHHLEKLNLYCSVDIDEPRRIPCGDIFPPNLKQLTLTGSHLSWSGMNTLATLPNLEVLKLKKNAFKGPEWEQLCEEGFPRLKFLLLQSLDLEHWKASAIHFPILQRLVLRNCIFLDEIPPGIGEIYTLQSIELDNCSFSVLMSAKKIQKEQQSLGNDNLNIRIGQTVHELKLVIFAWAFIHMSLKLKKQQSENGQC